MLKWEGELDPGRGYTNKDFAKPITLIDSPDFKLPVEVIEELKEEPEAEVVQKFVQPKEEKVENEGN